MNPVERKAFGQLGKEEFERWQKLADAQESAEDAMSAGRRPEDAAKENAADEAIKYWMRMSMTGGASGFKDTGAHLKFAQRLSERFGIEFEDAEEIVRDSQEDIESMVREEGLYEAQSHFRKFLKGAS